ncbi:hypothetical protein BGZ65_000535 [Modicella reniformis]|uniref:Uncharacterized protein n=1 Tax=Modicella reniformis TaxID=1440133 RepID=A0A9P6IRQ5_9FUNG|nr:hypothetical protein BGZ65_000535 [Modicella reniformis]
MTRSKSKPCKPEPEVPNIQAWNYVKPEDFDITVETSTKQGQLLRSLRQLVTKEEHFVYRRVQMLSKLAPSVISESIKNCFHHIPKLNDNQKKHLCETKAIDPCAARGDIVAPFQETNYEDTLWLKKMLFTFLANIQRTPEEMNEGSMAWYDFQREQDEAEAAVMKNPTGRPQ